MEGKRREKWTEKEVGRNIKPNKLFYPEFGFSPFVILGMSSYFTIVINIIYWYYYYHFDRKCGKFLQLAN